MLTDVAKGRIIFVEDTGKETFLGRPIISFRQFLAAATPNESVVLAADDTHVLSSLLSLGHGHILDVRALFQSACHYESVQSRSEARQLVISTVPRGGRHRVIYFLIALNEVLKGRIDSLNPHFATLSRTSGWNNRMSPYYLRETHTFLKADDIQVGHFIPPGSLAMMSMNAAVAREHSKSAARFLETCEREENLSLLAISRHQGALEPRSPPNANHLKTRYAHISRDIVDQLSSILTSYELLALELRRAGAVAWTLADYVDRCRNDLSPSAFGVLHGHIPLVLKDAITSGKSFTDVTLANGLFDSLIVDYALQESYLDFCVLRPSERLQAKLFHYELLNETDVVFFKELVTFARSASLSAQEAASVETATMLTNRRWALRSETELGHSLSFIPGNSHGGRQTPLITESNTTNALVGSIRLTVESKLSRTRVRTARRLFELLNVFGCRRPSGIISTATATF